MNDSASTAATANFRAAKLHREDTVAIEADITDLYFLASGLLIGGRFDDRGACATAKQKRSGVALRIAANQEDPLPLLRHHVREVRNREALADAALSIDRNDLRLFRRLADDYWIRLDRSFVAQEIVSLRTRRRFVWRKGEARALAWALQSKIILRQLGSSKAVR